MSVPLKDEDDGDNDDMTGIIVLMMMRKCHGQCAVMPVIRSRYRQCSGFFDATLVAATVRRRVITRQSICSR